MSGNNAGNQVGPGSMGAVTGGDYSGMVNGQMGGGGGDQNNGGGSQDDVLLAQQQAIMAMTGGSAGGGGFDAGASREALMNLLARQSYGGGGMGQMGGGIGQMPGMQGQQAYGGMGFQTQQGYGQDVGQDAQNAAMMGAFGGPNPAFSGFSPAMGMGMGMMGMSPAMLGGMSLGGLGGASGVQGGVDGRGMNDGSGRVMGDGGNGMNQQNMLIQQMLQQQAAGGGLWQQYGNMGPMMGADGSVGGGGMPSSYLSMLGQGVNPGGVAAAAIPAREASEAGVFQSGAIPDFSKSGKKARPKKPKNKPKRPLSAYNIFFKDERANILSEIPDKKDGEDDDDDEKKIKTEDGEEDEEGEDEKGPDGKKVGVKKRKRVPHGKIGFESLAKIIGQRWKELPPDELEVYKGRAEEDMKRYRMEMEAYVQKQREGLEQSREHLEKLVDEETKKRYFGDGGGV